MMPMPARRFALVAALLLVPPAGFAQLGSISGTVVDADGGSPLAGLPVYAYDGVNWPGPSTSTDAGGHYQLTGLAPGEYTVKTIASGNGWNFVDQLFDGIPCPMAVGCDPASADLVVVTADVETTGVDFTLEAGGILSGVVTDATSGEPLDGVSIEVSHQDYVDRFGGPFTSGGGAYSVIGLVSGSYYVKTDAPEGYADELWDDHDCVRDCDLTQGDPVLVVQGTETSGIDFALSASGGIKGVVTDALTGLPVVGVVVFVYPIAAESSPSVWDGTTDASGQYDTGLILPVGSYAVLAAPGNVVFGDTLYDGMSCVNGCDVRTGTPVTVTVGVATDGIDIELPRLIFVDGMEDGTLSGWSRVTDGS